MCNLLLLIDGFAQQTGTLTITVAKMIFENLPNGSYAAIVYHDEKDNGALDHKLAFPGEPMGFTNNRSLSLFSGMPTFTEAKACA